MRKRNTIWKWKKTETAITEGLIDHTSNREMTGISIADLNMKNLMKKRKREMIYFSSIKIIKGTTNMRKKRRKKEGSQMNRLSTWLLNKQLISLCL